MSTKKQQLTGTMHLKVKSEPLKPFQRGSYTLVLNVKVFQEDLSK